MRKRHYITPGNVPKNVKKTMCVFTMIKRMMYTHKTKSYEIHKLHLRIDNALNVFAAKESIAYVEIEDTAKEIWLKLSKEFTNKILITEMPKYIEYLTRLVRPNDFNALLKMSHIETNILISDDEKDAMIREQLKSLDHRLNEAFDTKSQDLDKAFDGEFLKKKDTTPKVKKERDKSKKKKMSTEQKSSKGMRKRIKMKEEKTNKLKSMISKSTTQVDSKEIFDINLLNISDDSKKRIQELIDTHNILMVRNMFVDVLELETEYNEVTPDIINAEIKKYEVDEEDLLSALSSNL